MKPSVALTQIPSASAPGDDRQHLEVVYLKFPDQLETLGYAGLAVPVTQPWNVRRLRRVVRPSLPAHIACHQIDDSAGITSPERGANGPRTRSRAQRKLLSCRQVSATS